MSSTMMTETTVLTSTSIISTTMKINRNRIYLPLSISLVSIILCISLSYWICLCLKHYLNVRETNRSSIDSWSSYDTEPMEIRTNQRRSSNESVELFRY